MKKVKVGDVKRLRLDRQQIRTLVPQDLVKINGGADVNPSNHPLCDEKF